MEKQTARRLIERMQGDMLGRKTLAEGVLGLDSELDEIVVSMIHQSRDVENQPLDGFTFHVTVMHD